MAAAGSLKAPCWQWWVFAPEAQRSAHTPASQPRSDWAGWGGSPGWALPGSHRHLQLLSLLPPVALLMHFRNFIPQNSRSFFRTQGMAVMTEAAQRRGVRGLSCSLPNLIIDKWLWSLGRLSCQKNSAFVKKKKKCLFFPILPQSRS